MTSTPHRSRTLEILLGVAGMTAVLAGFAGCSKKAEAPPPPPPDVVVTDVVQRDVPIVQEWVGEALGDPDVEIRARVPGFLEAMHFTEGGPVKKGQLLYSIDPSELKEALAQAQAEVARAETTLAYAVSDVARYRPLAEINAVSKRDLDAAVAKEESARAEVQAAKASKALAEINLSYWRITAPLSGLIGISKAKVGDYVGQGLGTAVLNTISRVDPIRVRFSITEREFLQYARRRGSASPEGGDQLRSGVEMILADGTVHAHKGYVDIANREVDAGTGSLMLEAVFPNPEGWSPRPVREDPCRDPTLAGALVVPQRAVRELQGQYQVFVVGSDDTVSIRPVTPGPRSGDLWVMSEGLKPGERVIVEGVQKVRGGVKVAAKTAAPGDAPAPAAGN